MYLKSAPLARIARDLKSGTLDLKEYINATCDRLEEVDSKLEAFLPEEGYRERLLKEADNLLQSYPEPVNRPLLFGVLIGVKDVYHADGFLTRAGSNLDPQALTGPEADCVKILRQEGALVLGKTVTAEFANIKPGPTRNPHNLAHTPGGSSSGSAAAVAAGLSPLTLGTQTVGSVNRPAAFCGVIGFKPSYNRISTAGMLYFSRSADHVGCFTQDIEGMILVSSILCHRWRDIKATYKPVLAVPRGKYLQQASDEALKAFEAQLSRLIEYGYEVKDIPALDDIEDVTLWHRKLIAAEVAIEHTDLYSRFASLYSSQTVAIIEEGKSIEHKELIEARRRQKELFERLESQMLESGIELWVTPATPGPAPEGIKATGSPAMNTPWTNTGLPSLSLPAGKTASGLPLGLQLIGPLMGDELVLSWALDVEKVFGEFQAYNV